MGTRLFKFSLRCAVYKDRHLFQTTMEKAQASGLDERFFVESNGLIDIEACLVQLLDPGSLAGCVVEHSEANELLEDSVKEGEAIYEFSVELRLYDAQELFEATMQIARASEIENRRFLRPNGSIDVESCLVQLLDPASLAGCWVKQSKAEELFEKSEDEEISSND